MASIPIGNHVFITLVDPISPPSTTAETFSGRLVVEAPGYCPPGPKCLFHVAVYRHSRLPGTHEIGILRVNLKVRFVMAGHGTRSTGNPNAMKRLAFVTIGIASLAVAACGGNNQDAVENAELNQPETEQLSDLANQAAADAAANEAAAQNAIENVAAEQNAAIENVTNPIDADEQNVSGM